MSYLYVCVCVCVRGEVRRFLVSSLGASFLPKGGRREEGGREEVRGRGRGRGGAEMNE